MPSIVIILFFVITNDGMRIIGIVKTRIVLTIKSNINYLYLFIIFFIT